METATSKRPRRRTISKNSVTNNSQESTMSQNIVSEDDDEIVIDVREIFKTIRKKIFVLILILLISSIGYASIRNFLKTPTYESTATIFLTPKVDSSGTVDQSSINSNKSLLNNAIALMKQENIMSSVAQEIGNMTPDEIADTLTVNAVDDTELISIKAVTEDPVLSKQIVSATLDTFISEMKESLNLSNISIVSQPKLDLDPVGPGMIRLLAEGALIGFVIDTVYIIVVVATSKNLKTKEEAERYIGIPVFVVLPDLEN